MAAAMRCTVQLAPEQLPCIHDKTEKFVKLSEWTCAIKVRPNC